MTELTVIMPLPHRCLHPNARVGWRGKLSAKAKSRKDAGLCALEALRGRDKPRLSVARVQLHWRFKRKILGGHDPDNLLAWMKHHFDGLTDAGIFSDDRGLIHHPPIVEYGCKPESVTALIVGGPFPNLMR